MTSIVKMCTLLVLSSILIACGGGGGGNDTTDRYAGTGELTLSITDAPVDGAKEVWITIDGILLKRAEGNGNEKRIALSGPDVDPVDGTLTVNLLELSGGQLSQLFNSESVTSGSYEWVRFSLVDNSTYIIWDDDTRSDLELPANKNELKTSGGFRVDSNESVAYIIDWDLRKSIVQRNSGYMLKPVLHIKRDNEFAYVDGSVNDSLYNTCDTDGLDDDDVPVIYIFSGLNVIPDDMDEISGTVEPVTSVYVSADPTQQFYAGPIDAGEYTFAFTCDGGLDSPEDDDVLTFPEAGRINVTLVAGDNGAITIP